MSTAVLATLAAAYIATIIVALFRSRTAAWNWLNLAAGAAALAWTATTGEWIPAAIWAFNCLIAIWNLRFRLKELRRHVWTEDRL